MKSDQTKSEEIDGNSDNRECALTREGAGVDSNLRLIRLFNHYRHDWMNEIQLLFGYVKLKKYDKLEDLMEKIKHKVQQESFISKLGHAELIVYLLSFQAEVKELLLEIEMEREIHLNELNLHLQDLHKLLTGLMEGFKSNSLHHTNGEHKLIVKLLEQTDSLRIEMEYEGLVAQDKLFSELQTVMQKSEQKVKWDIQLLDEWHAAMYIEVLFHT
jgi:sensor histidine kinase regulating citrate/malate metabolism